MTDEASATVRIATCPCGALEARCSGEPIRNSLCHCNDCKRRTGSAFAIQATYPEEQVELRGEAQVHERRGDEGYWGRFSFCATCGTTVWYRIERRPGAVSIPVGCFATPDFPPPEVVVYDNRTMAGMALTFTPEPERH